MSAVAVPVLLLGVLTLVGTVGYLLACAHLPDDDVPGCCRQRVHSFAAHARGTAVSAATVAGVGMALLLVDLV